MHGSDYLPAILLTTLRIHKLDTPRICILTQNSAMFVILQKMPKVREWGFFVWMILSVFRFTLHEIWLDLFFVPGV